jgi:hypothetical protein
MTQTQYTHTQCHVEEEQKKCRVSNVKAIAVPYAKKRVMHPLFVRTQARSKPLVQK